MAVSQRKAGAVLSYVQIFLSNTVGLIYAPFAIRMLGQSQYGLAGTAASFTGYLSLLGFGIGGAYIRWNAKYRAENDVEGERRLNGMFFTIFSIIGILSLIVGVGFVIASEYIFSGSFTKSELYDLKVIVALQVVSVAASFFFTTVNSCIMAYEQFLVVRIVSIINIFISPIINIIVMIIGGKAVALSIVSLALTLINFFVYFIYARVRLKMKFVFRGFKADVFKGIFLFSIFLFLNAITDLITDSTDSIILGAVSGTVAVAIYTVGHNFKNYFLQFSTAVSSVFAPKVNQLVAKDNDNTVLSHLMTRIGRVQFYIVSLILIGYIAVGQPFINLWAGENYSSAYWIGFFLLCGAYIPLFQNVGIEIQKAKNKHKARSVVYLLVAVFNIALTIPFSIWWQGIGAAFATFICCMLGNVLFMNFYYQKGIGLDMFHFWKEILKIVPSFIPAIIVCILINAFLPVYKIQWLLVAVIIICVVYFLSIYFLSMNTYEKNLLFGFLRKLRRKKSEEK